MEGILSDPFEAAALRQRLAATRRREGLPTKFLEAIGGVPMSIIGAGAGLVDAAKDAAAEQTGTAPSVSTDYDPRRFGAQLNAETALNTMGAPVMGAGAVPGMTLNSGLRLPPRKIERVEPKLVGAYHDTPTPKLFNKFEKSKIDEGTHVTIDPDLSYDYSQMHLLDAPPEHFPECMKKIPRENPVDFLPAPRTMPVVADIRSAFKFPGDAVNWGKADNVIGILEDVARSKGNMPRSIISDFENIAKQSGGWGKNFIPALQEKGFDSLIYPHVSHRDEYFKKPRYNTIMAFEPEQIIPRFTPEAQELIKRRGIVEPIKNSVTAARFEDWEKIAKEPWKMPRGILKKYGEDATPEQKNIMYQDVIAKDTAKINAYHANKEKQKEFVKKYQMKEIGIKEVEEEFKKLWGPDVYENTFKPGHTPHFLSPPTPPPPQKWLEEYSKLKKSIDPKDHTAYNTESPKLAAKLAAEDPYMALYNDYLNEKLPPQEYMDKYIAMKGIKPADYYDHLKDLETANKSWWNAKAKEEAKVQGPLAGNPVDTKITLLSWEQTKAAEQLKKGKITKKEYGKIYHELEDQKDQYFGGMLSKK